MSLELMSLPQRQHKMGIKKIIKHKQSIRTHYQQFFISPTRRRLSHFCIDSKNVLIGQRLHKLRHHNYSPSALGHVCVPNMSLF